VEVHRAPLPAMRAARRALAVRPHDAVGGGGRRGLRGGTGEPGGAEVSAAPGNRPAVGQARAAARGGGKPPRDLSRLERQVPHGGQAPRSRSGRAWTARARRWIASSPRRCRGAGGGASGFRSSGSRGPALAAARLPSSSSGACWSGTSRGSARRRGSRPQYKVALSPGPHRPGAGSSPAPTR
jgi:hypothetical protein